MKVDDWENKKDTSDCNKEIRIMKKKVSPLAGQGTKMER